MPNSGETLDIKVPAMPKVIDISVTLRKSLAPWPGEDFWSMDPVCRIAEGAVANVSKITAGCHFGTHVDSPWHFGKTEETVETISLKKMVIQARVLDLTHVDKVITRSDLEGKLDGTSAVLLKTANSGKQESGEPFDLDFVHLDESAAQYLVDQKIETVGIDYASVEGYHVEGGPVHHILLGNGVFIVEGIDLTDVAPKDYLFIVLPLKIEGADGAPARAILIDS